MYASFYKVIMCHHEVKTYCSINGFFFFLVKYQKVVN